jgi:hypothetical protein
MKDAIAALEQTRPSDKDFLQAERMVTPSAITHVAVAKCLPRSEEPVRHGFGACPYSKGRLPRCAMWRLSVLDGPC